MTEKAVSASVRSRLKVLSSVGSMMDGSSLCIRVKNKGNISKKDFGEDSYSSNVGS